MRSFRFLIRVFTWFYLTCTALRTLGDPMERSLPLWTPIKYVQRICYLHCSVPCQVHNWEKSSWTFGNNRKLAVSVWISSRYCLCACQNVRSFLFSEQRCLCVWQPRMCLWSRTLWRQAAHITTVTSRSVLGYFLFVCPEFANCKEKAKQQTNKKKCTYLHTASIENT